MSALGPAGSDVPSPGADGDSIAMHRPAKAPNATLRADLSGRPPAGRKILRSLAARTPCRRPPVGIHSGVTFFVRPLAMARQFQFYLVWLHEAEGPRP